MLLGIGYLHRDATGAPNPPVIKAGGFFALLAAFLAWYNALAGIADDSNRYAFPSDYRTTEPELTLHQLLHRPSSTFSLVRQGDEGEGQTGRGWQQDGLNYDVGTMRSALRAGSVYHFNDPSCRINL